MATADIDSETQVRGLEELVLRVNDHPTVRLKLLAEVSRVLEDGLERNAEERALLADKVERWRYQILNHFAGFLTDDHRELTRRLDLLANRLSPDDSRPPRLLQSRLRERQSSRLDEEVESCLDPGRPLEDVERAAKALTDRHYMPETGPLGRKMLLYAPLYLSNHCINHCLYCGFRYPNSMERVQLDTKAALAEAEVLASRGFQHVLVVTGEFPRFITVDYLVESVEALAAKGLAISIEVAPQTTLDYRRLKAAGTIGVTLYQETYDVEAYKVYHPKGTKAWYDWRLEGPERAVEAGIQRIGLGILLGLGEPVKDLRALVTHGEYLLERSPGLKLAFSLPRIHDAPEPFRAPYQVDDETFIRFYCALRTAVPTANLVLSTREPAPLRDRLARSCITQMSAGSSTSPGGYQEQATGQEARQQFPVCDHRGPEEVADVLTQNGFQVIWKLADF